MKIVHIIPGSGGSFYCGNCLRDSKYYSSIKKLGHDVLKIPMYLPLFSHEDISESKVPVFYGAVSLYVKQTWPVLKRSPKWVDTLLNSEPILKQAAKMAGSTRATGLEEMTISMLLGENGDQSNELEEMILWLEKNYRPDIIHLSNALLLGLAGPLTKRIGVPVVCSLQDEDVWVDVMSESHRQYVWDLMNEKSVNIAKFISVSDYYTEFSIRKMKLDPDKVETVHLGVDPDDYQYINSIEKDPAIGYLSRMNHENGLDILIDAFILLKQESRYEKVKLYISGGSTGDDKPFIKEQKHKIDKAGLAEETIFLENFENDQRHIFFERVSLLSVPVRNGEAFGIYLTEAMASGIPVVQPALGAFPEIVSLTGGGLIYKNNEPKELAKSLSALLSNNDILEGKSKNARKGVEEKFNINKQAEKLIGIYSSLVKS